MQRVRDAADRLSRVVTALLSLFRSGGELSPTQVDVTFDVSDTGVVIKMLDNRPGLDHVVRNRINTALADQQYEQNMGARSHGGRLQLVPTEQGFGVTLSLGRLPD